MGDWEDTCMAISTKGGQKLELMIGDIGIEFSLKNQVMSDGYSNFKKIDDICEGVCGNATTRASGLKSASFVNQGRNNQSCRLRPVPARLCISYAAKPETVD
ncbi:hypothetical protein Goklo_016359 [Gossypium klotzschianum]|uniref:Uncharacterized protein n=2 Tax=Gossypium TaxID=3633 RepID=A0A7J8UDV7_9ROSI|nr:hypothetical protein [Gossypium klotzschianum]